MRGCCSQPWCSCKQSPHSRERSGTTARHCGDAGWEGQTHLWPSVSQYSCYSATELFRAPYGCPTNTQQKQSPRCMGKAGCEQSLGCEQDRGQASSFTAAKFSPCRRGIDVENMQKNMDNPHKAQFLTVVHEKLCVAGGQEGGSSTRARESIKLPSAAQGEAVARQK